VIAITAKARKTEQFYPQLRHFGRADRKEQSMATFKAFGLAMLLLGLTISLSYGQEVSSSPISEIVLIKTATGTI